MSSLLSQAFRGMKAVAEFAASQAEKAEVENLQARERGNVDLTKVRTIIGEFAKQLQMVSAAIDQLQQRVSNLEGFLSRLEARLPPTLVPSPQEETGGWIKQTSKNNPKL